MLGRFRTMMRMEYRFSDLFKPHAVVAGAGAPRNMLLAAR